MELNIVQSAMCRLIKRYTEQQYIVLEVISELRADLLSRDQEQLSAEEFVDITKQYSHVPQTGQWGKNKEWLYFFHGNGCRLTHSETGECLDWDASDPRVFDLYAFARWIGWLVLQDVENEDVSTIKSATDVADQRTLEKFVSDTLGELLSLMRLTYAKGSAFNKYMLVSEMGNTSD